MWYEDLAKFDVFSEKDSKLLCGQSSAEVMMTAVGWLENGKPYATGKSPESLVGKLQEFITTQELNFVFLGIHICDQCDLGYIENAGSKTCFIYHQDKVYFFPDLIIHYIENHSYLPPGEFIEAVLEPTPQETLEYFKQIRENRFSINK